MSGQRAAWAAILFAALVQFAGVVWFASNLNARMVIVESAMREIRVDVKQLLRRY